MSDITKAMICMLVSIVVLLWLWLGSDHKIDHHEARIMRLEGMVTVLMNDSKEMK